MGVMGASSIAASVLGLSLGDDPRRAFVFGGLVGFVTVVGATLVVLWPYSWTFHCGPKAMAAGYIEQGYSIDDMLRDHSEELETFYDKNDLRLQKMYKALQLAVMGLGLEVLFLMLDVLVGG
ncbi:MAG: hypothetical protein Q8M22_10355 [Actinomycetota bacterium]|nr:hypothetical protein [Actinomycetota bacterium]